ncbi:phospholipase A1-IIdelta [Olea europaea var. sylvestris]|uniref:Phospholipase A1 n=1 Tax=Olea europaea subsp. europaea TaxID=158383 RepID=A0A8S0RX23_OLEEU|nr:phospholipase A1-IIdelta [Olea europaea var. sylvestris]CAA2983690.1 phospholipase A1-IIdelta-like [Olea europaea subsp. europaea]CAA3006320.1 phospholipase A1-IIdelta-like [Olea europaea subsp. europaea]
MVDSSQTEPTWPELLGRDDWNGLLDPLSFSLRRLILRCGDFCQATYDAFNNDGNSKYAGSSRYGKNAFFNKVMLESASDYQVYCFLYATAKVDFFQALFLHSLSREAWDRESNWIGYIAVTTDEVSRVLGRREAYVVWRGTSRNYEWLDVLGARPESAEPLLRPKPWEKKSPDDSSSSDEDENEPKVMNGWLTIYVSNDPNSPFTKLSAREQLLAKINALRDQYKDEDLSIILTGHSLGASVAILSAFDLVENGVTDIPVSAIVFGSPQVGNKAFNERLNKYRNLNVLHIKNEIDLIPHYPSRLLGYSNTGIELEIDNRKSPSLKDSRNPSDWHNLQAMLHVVAGWNGSEGEFELKVKRSLALVNKSSAILNDDYLIPGSWWIEKNKGMILDENGDWILAPPSDEDRPVPEF